MSETMRAAVFEGRERIVIDERPIPRCGPTDAIVKVTMTTICGTDVHIWREEYPVDRGRGPRPRRPRPPIPARG